MSPDSQHPGPAGTQPQHEQPQPWPTPTPPAYGNQPGGGYDAGPSYAAAYQAGSYGPTAQATGAPHPPYGQAPYPPAGQGGSSFFHALFDFSFSRYITLTFAKVIYGISIGLSIVAWLIYLFAGFAYEPGLGVLTLLLGWIPALFFIIVARVSLEFAVAMIKTAENTSALAGRR
ncbi:DUF4282 domain-containing protein [Georgenia yuyongxinii]|uniref:DUF4282 domain-containing protein n=1 Tax=Georgenia yuyongxinii TaxID=2589797 RepID=A0A552WMY8_9MICO|nr:DUF4282 domain-containing protein [Georgenia yuyongxinii]TRW43873.1 DUF4282 domain-containing protein [Georgenia yuyongxinii]